MNLSIQNMVSLKQFLCSMPIIGFTLAAINDLQINLFSDYSKEPVFTSFAYELSSMLPMISFVIVFISLFYMATRILFDSRDSGDIETLKKGSEADQALLHGLGLVIFGGVIYMIIYVVFDSPVRIIFG